MKLNVAARRSRTVLSAEEFLGRWQGGEEGRRAIRRYLDLAFGADLAERDLYRQEFFDLYRMSGFAGGEEVIVQFLELLAALRRDLAELPLPMLSVRLRRPRRANACPLVEEFLGGRQMSIRKELYLGAGLLALQVGRSMAELTAVDFAREDVVKACAMRISAQGASRAQRRAAYLFYRAQLEAAGVGSRMQEAILQPLAEEKSEQMPRGVSPTVATYIEYRRALGLGTWRDKARELRRFETWVTECDHGTIGEDGHLDTQILTADHVAGYRSFLADRVQKITLSFRLSHLRTYLHWLRRNGLVDAQVLRPLRRVSERSKRKKKVTVWEIETLRKFRDVVVRSQTPLVRCAIGLLVVTVGRAQELYDLRLQDIDLVGAQIRLQGKGRGSHERWVPITSLRLLADLRAYLAERPRPQKPGEEALFLLPDGRPLTATALRCEFIRLCEQAGIEGRWRLGVLRRTGATMLQEAGVDTLVRAQIMGHRDLRSQEHYVRNDFEHAARRLLAREEAYEDPMAGARDGAPPG